jgi:hypothetical protein
MEHTTRQREPITGSLYWPMRNATARVLGEHTDSRHDTTMQNLPAPRATPHNADLLPAFCEEIEIAWNTRRDAKIVDRLAADYPALAEALYEFFALLIQAEIDLDQPDPALEEHDVRARERLESGGHAEAAEIARRAGTFATRTNAAVAVPPPHAAPPASASSPSVATGHSDARTTPESAHPRTSGPPVGDPSDTDTPAAESSAAGVRTGRGPVGMPATPGAAARQSRHRNFLGLLIDTTRESPEAIAKGIGITTDFLVSVDVLGDRLPARAREELARRGAARYSHHHLSREQLLDRLGASTPQAMAASRRSHYDRRLTYEDVVRQSKLSAADEAFWLSLSD